METLLNRIRRHEGTKLRVYKDSRGYWSIGCGRCLDTKGITSEEAEYLLNNDILDARQSIAKSLPWSYDLDSVRQDILIEMCFQLGLAGVLGFPQMIAALKNKNYAEAAKQMLDSAWHKQTPSRAEELANLMLTGGNKGE